MFYFFPKSYLRKFAAQKREKDMTEQKPLSPAFEGFEHHATECAKFLNTEGIFSLSLKSGRVVHHFSDKPELFKQWLLDHNVKDLRSN